MGDDTVWVIGAGPLQVPLIEEAHGLGLRVVASDGNPQAPGRPAADLFLELDTHDVEGHRATAHQFRQGLLVPSEIYRLVGCCTAGADVGPSVAAVAAELGTPGLPVEVARRTHHKLWVRERLRAAGLDRLQPAYRLVDLDDPHQPYEALLDLHRTCAWPFVLKPLEACASRGVSLVQPGLGGWGDGLADAISRAAPYGGLALLEEGLSGSEHSVEGILGPDGDLRFFNIVDRQFRYDAGIPFELGHLNPSRLTPAQWSAARALWMDVADALEVDWGPFKLDLRWTAAGPKVLEATARLSAGWDCQCTTPLSTWRRPMRTVLELACGLPLSAAALDERQPWDYAACVAILPPPGRVRVVHEDRVARVRQDIAGLVWAVEVGQVIPPYEHCATRPGFAICVAPDPELALGEAAYAAQRVAMAIEMEPL